MCIAFWQSFSPQDDTDLAFVLASNRDEFFSRPTETARWHTHGSTDILSGLDLVAEGTWLGLTRTGRFALLTNFTETPLSPTLPDGSARPSRGTLVNDFLCSESPVSEYVSKLGSLTDYAGFNLLIAQLPNGPFSVISNRPSPSVSSEQVVFQGDDLSYGAISNGHFMPSHEFIDSHTSEAWEKVRTGAQRFKAMSRNKSGLEEGLFDLMSSPSPSWDTSDPFGTIRSTICVSPCGLKRPSTASTKMRPLTDRYGAAYLNEDGVMVMTSDAIEEAVEEEMAKEDRAWTKGAYGTRSQAYVYVYRDGKVRFVERETWDVADVEKWSGKTQVFEFGMEKSVQEGTQYTTL